MSDTRPAKHPLTDSPTPLSHALDVIEFRDVLERIAAGAIGEAGRRRVLRLRPLGDPTVARHELLAVDTLRQALGSEEGFELGRIPDAGSWIARLAVDGSVLDSEALVGMGAILRCARLAAGDLSRWRDASEVIDRLAGGLWHDRSLEERIDRCFDENGEVSDSASPELRRLRRQLQDGRSRLVQRLEDYAGGLPDRIRVADGSVTVRGGRYCIPVRREGKGTVGGLVHDASASRQTLFVEPAMAIDAMNDIRELEIGIQREIDRILRGLTDDLREHGTELSATYEALCELDALRARALFAQRLDCALPEVVEASQPLVIRSGRHPLLAVRDEPVVPFDLELNADERVLLISGPNAGGKTVLLKSVGLFVALARSGVVPPVGPGTRLPFLGGPYAIIGDEQSIAASLSTFGAQARNLAEILASAGPDDLVLIDEIGSATDPSEGGALAAATLSALSRTVRLTIATTHLGDLKGLAEEETGAVNASLQFDSDRLQPTYRLEKYRPGRSYALEIAARLGVPKDVLADARARLDTDHRSLDELLARLEREQSEVDELRRELDEETASIRSRASELERREQEVEVLLVEARRDAEEAVESALKQARSDVEEAIRHLETEYAAAEPRGEDDSLRESRRAARDVVERGIRESRGRREALMTSPNAPPSSRELRVGDRVRWGEGSRLGVLVELRGDRGVVELDGVRLTMAADDLSPIGSETAPGEASIDRKRPRPRPERREHRPNLDVKTEIDLRGLRAEEVEAALTPVLDAAVVAELPWLRIIHGKGTGALRKVVGDLLDRDPRVSEHRTGDPREGGTGVTMVKFE